MTDPTIRQLVDMVCDIQPELDRRSIARMLMVDSQSGGGLIDAIVGLWVAENDLAASKRALGRDMLALHLTLEAAA